MILGRWNVEMSRGSLCVIVWYILMYFNGFLFEIGLWLLLCFVDDPIISKRRSLQGFEMTNYNDDFGT